MILIIITGVNRGLGYELLNKLIAWKNADIYLLGISRKRPSLPGGEKLFTWFESELVQLPSQKNQLELLLKEYNPQKVIFINNAGTIEPLGKANAISADAFQNSLQINVMAPLTIISAIFSSYGNNSKVDKTFVNISSGAAFRSIKGWAAYCSSKAYMNMFFNCLQDDMQEIENFRVIQVDPGAIDTEMQAQIRKSQVGSPTRTFLNDLYQSGRLKSASTAANEIIEKYLAFLI